MCFDEGFDEISSGYVRFFKTVAGDEEPSGTIAFGKGAELRYTRIKNISSPCGQVYGQYGLLPGKALVGLASYHFSDAFSQDLRAWISYEMPLPGWKLESGAVPPKTKQFENVAWEEDTRTFRATAEWTPDSFGGSQKWVYTFCFSDDYSHIEDGKVECYANADDDEPGEVHLYGVHLNYRRVGVVQ